MKAMKIRIADVKVTHRTIQIPDTCPGCKADLRAPGAVNRDDYMQYNWAGTTWNGKEFTWDQSSAAGDAEIVDDDSAHIRNVFVCCAKCERNLVPRKPRA